MKTESSDVLVRSTDGRLVALTHLKSSAGSRGLPDDDTTPSTTSSAAAVSMIPDPNDRAVVSAEEAFTELGIDRSTGYKAIRDGTFPVPIIRIGRIIRVPTVALRRALHLDIATTLSDVGDDGSG